MPSNRRIKVAVLVVVLIILTIIYVTTGRSSTYNSQFYLKTVQALERERLLSAKHNEVRHAPVPNPPDPVLDESNNVRFRGQKQRPQLDRIDTDDTLRERLREAERMAKKSADERWRDMQDAADLVKGGAAQGGNTAGRDRNENDQLAKEIIEQGIGVGRPPRDAPKPNVQRERESVEAAVDSRPIPVAAAQHPIAEAKHHEDNHVASAAKAKAEVEDEEPGAHADEYENAGTKANSPAARGGRRSFEDTMKNNKQKLAEAANENTDKGQKQSPSDPRLHEASEELDRVLRLAPIVIFSKSYCPYSKKAKRIMQQAFRIVPAPYVVELDQHELGSEIQQLLAAMTGRKTVPNVMVNAKSIGGGDDIEHLWETGKLKKTVMGIAGKRISAFIENWDVLKNGWKD